MSAKTLVKDRKAKQLFYKNVYDHLLDLLLTGELVPGDVINRQEIADTQAVSRTPVQKAVSQLESEGFLTTYPR
jgi:DNA-binding GntR family transcriptional regulator